MSNSLQFSDSIKSEAYEKKLHPENATWIFEAYYSLKYVSLHKTAFKFFINWMILDFQICLLFPDTTLLHLSPETHFTDREFDRFEYCALSYLLHIFERRYLGSLRFTSQTASLLDVKKWKKLFRTFHKPLIYTYEKLKTLSQTKTGTVSNGNIS